MEKIDAGQSTTAVPRVTGPFLRSPTGVANSPLRGGVAHIISQQLQPQLRNQPQQRDQQPSPRRSSRTQSAARAQTPKRDTRGPIAGAEAKTGSWTEDDDPASTDSTFSPPSTKVSASDLLGSGPQPLSLDAPSGAAGAASEPNSRVMGSPTGRKETGKESARTPGKSGRTTKSPAKTPNVAINTGDSVLLKLDTQGRPKIEAEVKYIGKVHFASDTWVGLDLSPEFVQYAKNDGSVEVSHR